MHARTVALVLLSLVACGPSSGDASGGGDGGGSESEDDSPGEGAEASTGVGGDDAPDASSDVGGDPEQPTGLRDESGALFAWICGADADRPDHCSIGRIDGASPPFPDCNTPGYSYSWSSHFHIDGACGYGDGDPGYRIEEDSSRCVVCDTDADCPQIVDRDDYFECREGYCQNIDPEKYADLPSFPEFACGNTAPRYGCEDPACSSGIPE